MFRIANLQSIPFLLVALWALLIFAPPVLGAEEGGKEGTGSGYLSGKLPPIQPGAGQPSRDPDRYGEEPPPDIQFVPWSSWSEGQLIRPMRRVTFTFSFGPLNPSMTLPGADNAGGGISYGSAFGTGITGCLEGGVTLAPFLNLSLSFLGSNLVGKEVNQEVDVGGTAYRIYTSDWAVSSVLLVARFKFPLNTALWKMFRFSRAELVDGFVPFFRLGFGGSSLGALDVDTERVSDSTFSKQRIYLSSRSPSFTIGAGMEIRWHWGGASFEMASILFGTPRSGWAGLGSPSSFSAVYFAFGFGVNI